MPAKNNIVKKEGGNKSSNEVINNFASYDKEMCQCIQTVLEILRQEHYKEKQSPFTDEQALNLDKVETLKKKGIKGSKTMKTVDMVIGLENKKLLLVEIKLDCEKVDNIAKEILEKITYSKDMLKSNPVFVSFYNKILVLLNNDNFEQKKRRLKNLLISRDKNIEPYKVSQLYSDFMNMT